MMVMERMVVVIVVGERMRGAEERRWMQTKGWMDGICM